MHLRTWRLLAQATLAAEDKVEDEIVEVAVRAITAQADAAR